jgi:TolB protein
MRLILFFLAALSVSHIFAADRPYIAVGGAKIKKTIIAFPEIKIQGDTSGIAKSVQETVSNDLLFMDMFKFMGASAFIEPQAAGITLDSFKLSDWSSIGAEFVIKAKITPEGGNVALEGYLYDVAGAKQVLGKRYVAARTDVKTLAHTFANNIVEALTGLPGIFLTKIAMSCDRSGKKEIYVMNFDGTDVKQITTHRSIAFAPAWSPDGTRIAYSLFTRHRGNIKNIDLYEYDFRTNNIRMLSNRKGINSGASYSPDGNRIALTMSFLGNPEIFSLNPSNGQAERLTSSFGFDVDPSWAPDGKSLAFVSSRTGVPMVFSMTTDGSKVQRLTYAGRYNATPTWSPQNNKIGFAGWIDGKFDIFIMNVDGTTIERLTKNQGNNEDPHFSPDGIFLAFSSNRTGQQNIYVMNVDGTFVKRLTYGLGNCVAPKWSASPKS